ncbi:hypothetical protein ACLOJK_009288 [Asimina triloba]
MRSGFGGKSGTFPTVQKGAGGLYRPACQIFSKAACWLKKWERLPATGKKAMIVTEGVTLAAEGAEEPFWLVNNTKEATSLSLQKKQK